MHSIACKAGEYFIINQARLVKIQGRPDYQLVIYREI